MTDIIKDFGEKISGKVMAYLKAYKDFELDNIKMFEQEIEVLGSIDPLVIAFGDMAYGLLQKHFGSKYRIKKVRHYSHYISK